MSKEDIEILTSFKNYIKDLENKQECLYDNEEFYRDDIEQNELFLKMLHAVLNLIQKLQEENKKKDKIIDSMAKELCFVFDSQCQECEQDIDTASSCLKQYFRNKAIQEEK